MIDYTVAAIPTVYNGRQYRSRLEARWAAFFDYLGLAHEYEPFDCGPWSPDFLLTDLRVLVEVKPLTEYDDDTWQKMRGTFPDCPDMPLFLTAVAPRLADNLAVLGWCGTAKDETATTAYLCWTPHGTEPYLMAEIWYVSHDGPLSWHMLSGLSGGKDEVYRILPYADFGMAQWAKATNAVQWTGPQ